ncbi:hypothetical protein SERLA73DRAFT_91425 [Serpula lacrymans var. lacrymans S7.3]|uniref:Uncharacterized protein n=1 Tax=Serpula lacrymans var. lacrymans (strain S7.3) TaxID=936435 RepID=F8Q1K2_SERL3|nr:hypothetical protein SERLA73DRAFT_91425 [Serpula lacrymans var. lacrymans S7.3]
MTEDRLHEAAAVSVESSALAGKVENAQAARQAALIQDTSAASIVKKLGSPLIQKSRQSASLASPISETPSRHSSVTKSSTSQPPSTVVTPLRTMSDKGKGKRKAEEVDITPPDQKKEGQRATFVIPAEGRTQRISASGSSSHAPSSYHRKRARLSSPPPPSQSRPTSAQTNQFGSWSSHTSSRALPAPRAPSHAASTRSNNPQSLARQPSDRRRSMSQISIPISALVSPHVPSITTSSKFHMRDPRRPPKKLHDTEWSLRFKTEDEPGSPLHAWAFFIGFILFPAWWIAALFFRVPKTRTVGEPEIEKAVTIDDPQVEHDAKTWRFRCRIPFIVLVAIFVPR